MGKVGIISGASRDTEELLFSMRVGTRACEFAEKWVGVSVCIGMSSCGV